MALIPSLNTPSSATTAKGQKTKAKQRYLKAKKNRSKNAKKQGGNVPGRNQSSAIKHGQDEDASEKDSESSGSEEDAEGDSNSDADSPTEPKPILETRPPKKKRKLAIESTPQEVSSPLDDAPLDTNAMALDEIPPVPQSPKSLPALPRFPLPVQPEAPSPSVLYLQGVDQALIEAEIIDPRRTMALSSESPVDDSQLSLRIRQRLSHLGILELFAVQTAILPFLLPPSPTSRSLYLPYDPLRDLCVSAPTGSGKTLAYVLPIVETLSTRVVTRLRALVVLPTRDLVSQVRETFEALCKGTGLKIGIATGQHSFAQEQAQLVGDQVRTLNGGYSKVDILICTPGRLMDHLQGTKNFTLQHLRFLVIDEADRLVTEAFQDWLAQVLASTHPDAPTINSHSGRDSLSTPNFLPLSDSTGVPYPDALHPAWLHAEPQVSQHELTERPHSSCQKLLFSATLTRDPSKIAALKLRDAKYFVVGDGKEVITGVAEGEGGENVDENGGVFVGEKFAFPSTLREHMLVCSTAQKPLMLLYLMHSSHSVTNALVFTKSAESTTRLVKLIQSFEKSYARAEPDSIPVDGEPERTGPIVAEAYSSDLTPSVRKSILERFKGGKIGILVCSDLISRGIDISQVSHVVSYDVPVDVRKYVHRVGRTARAGRTGDAWSLVEEQEARHFKQLMTGAGHLSELKKVKVSQAQLAPYLKHYDIALDELKLAYGRQ